MDPTWEDVLKKVHAQLDISAARREEIVRADTLREQQRRQKIADDDEKMRKCLEHAVATQPGEPRRMKTPINEFAAVRYDYSSCQKLHHMRFQEMLPKYVPRSSQRHAEIRGRFVYVWENGKREYLSDIYADDVGPL